MSIHPGDRMPPARGRRYDSLGRLALGVAHDFNNILTTVLGLSSFMRHRTAPGQALDTELAEIERACERGAALTAQLLSLQPEGIAGGAGALHPQDALTRLQPLLHRALGEQIRLEMRFDPDLEFIAFDAEELADLVLHAAAVGPALLPAGGIVRMEAGPGDAVPDERPRARLDVSLVAQHEPGAEEEVLRLELHLPVAARSLELRAGEPGRATPAAEESPSGLHPLLRRTVLLVEDDDGLRRVCMRILEDRGFWVTTAFDAVDALQACEQRGGAFDLLVTDCVLPGMSGGDLWATLSERYPMPAVFVTGYPAAAFGRRGLPGRPHVVVPKPFTPEQLVEAMGQVLREADDPGSRIGVPTWDGLAPGRTFATGATC